MLPAYQRQLCLTRSGQFHHGDIRKRLPGDSLQVTEHRGDALADALELLVSLGPQLLNRALFALEVLPHVAEGLDRG
jgi:hypothetical protein